jgi:DNA-binding response OmpR family regulator
MHENTDAPTVLLVDDEPGLVGLYEVWLSDACEVLTATGGEEALDIVDESVDIVFLDRRMPRLSGDEVLATLRERGLEMQVAMLTAVEPDEDIVDMPFDDYLIKPVEEEDVKAVIDILLQRQTYDEQSQRLFSLASKKAALEASSNVDHEDSDQYAALTERIEALRADLDETVADLAENDYAEAFVALD